MFRRLFFTGILSAALFSVSAQNLATSFSVSDDGQIVSWQITKGFDTRLFSASISTLIGSDPSGKVVSANQNSIGICDSDTKTITWAAKGGIYLSNIQSDTISGSKFLVPIQERDGFFGISNDGSRFLFSSRPERKQGGQCSPFYSALVVAKKSGDSIVYSGPLTSTKECSFVHTAGFTRSGFICYNSNREKGICLLREQANGTYQKDELPLPENTVNGTGYWSNGSDRIFGIFRMLTNDADSAFGIYCYEFSGGKYLAPVLLAIERTKWRPPISISPDGNAVAWTSLPYYEKKSKYENRKLKISRFENKKWTEPEVLINFGEFAIDRDVTYGTILLTNQNLYLRNYGNEDFCFYSSLDQKGILTRMNLLDHLKSKKREQTTASYFVAISDTIVEGEYYPVTFTVFNPGKDSLKFRIYNTQSNPFSINRLAPREGAGAVFVNVIGMSQVNPIYRIQLSNDDFSVGPGDSIHARIWVASDKSNSEQVFQIDRTGGAADILRRLVVKSNIVCLRKDRSFYAPSYYSNGLLMESFYKEGKDKVVYRSWYRNGNPKSVFVFNENYQQKGDFSLYNEQGGLLTECRKEGKRKYSVNRYYSNHTLQESYTLRSSAMVGKWKRWDANGQLVSEARFRKFHILTIFTPGLKTMNNFATSAKYYREYYANGKLKCEVHYSKTGRKKGKWQFWYEDGKIWTERKYFRGKLSGEYKIYNPDGTICFHIHSESIAPGTCPMPAVKLPTLNYGTQPTGWSSGGFY